MTLPTALLISNMVNKSIAGEIQETIGIQSSMSILSCKCSRHSKESYLVPTTTKCVLPLSEEGLKLLATLAKSVKIKSISLKPKTVRAYSFFSEMNQVEEITCSRSTEPKNKQELMKCLSVALDSLENIDCRFKKSFINHQNQELEKLKIFYNKRDILDLGSNLRGGWSMTHPPNNNPDNSQSFQSRPKLCIRSQCPFNDCGFEDVLPLM